MAFKAPSHAALRTLLCKRGMSTNGVFGMKHSLDQSHFSWLIHELRQFPGVKPSSNRTTVWEQAFPNHRHIFMTRRHKVRLAVSWWKAICSHEWHRAEEGKSPNQDLRNKSDFAASIVW